MHGSLAACAAGALLALLTGCGGGGGGGAAWHDPNPLPPDTMQYGHGEVGRHGGRMVVAQTGDPRSFNQPITNEQSSSDINNLLWASLVGYDYVGGGMQMELARAWERSADSLSYTIHLRRGIRFSDGTPITAADVLFSAEVSLDSTLHPTLRDQLHANGRPYRFSAPDSETVVVQTPVPVAQAMWTVSSLRILPRHRMEAAFRAGTFASIYTVSTPPESLVTSGAFRLKQFFPGEKTVLEPNPYWFRVDARGQRLPYLDELVFLIVPDQTTAALKFQAGEVDAVDSVKPEDYKSYEDQQASGGFTLHTVGPSLSTNFLWFNLNTVKEASRGRRVGDPYVGAVKYAWFHNDDFRRAVSKAIDREAMIRGPYFGYGVKNWATTTPGNRVWSSPEFAGDDYDPEGARAILRSIGMEDRNGDGVIEDATGHPVRFSMATNTENEVRKQLLNMVREDLAKVGIEVAASPTQFNALMSNLRDDFNYDAILLGLGSGIPPDPANSVNVFRSSGVTHFWNTRQRHPETPEEARLDELAARLTEGFDEAERHRAYAEVVRIINGKNWFIWLPSQVMRLPVRNRLGNAVPQVVPHRLLWNAERIFVKQPSRTP